MREVVVNIDLKFLESLRISISALDLRLSRQEEELKILREKGYEDDFLGVRVISSLEVDVSKNLVASNCMHNFYDELRDAML